jgi:enoyl-CoA hydratase/carnithine racemase
MSNEKVCSQIENQIAILTLNHPQKRNPLSESLCWELIEKIKQAEKDDSVHVILLTGAGSTFCAGGDLKEFTNYQEKSASEILEEGKATTELFKTLSSLNKPIIGAINGHALGGGFGLAAACHYSIASESAKFGTTEIKLGLFPLVIMPAIIEAVGPKKALELGFTGEIFSAEKACELGVVNRVVPAELLLEEAMAFANQLASSSPLALKIGLEYYNKARDMEWNKKLDYANTLRVIAFLSSDLKEGATAFLEKREPVWIGK